MSLGTWNKVRGVSGWFYGLMTRSLEDGQPTVEFYVYRGTESLGPLRASAYRTTTLARQMGEHNLRGYEHEARQAIYARGASGVEA